MGVDEALLASAIAGVATLRFYRWEGFWLSLGYSQRLDRRRIASCADAGVGIVRRVTGGGAVLHGGDLTYCLTAGLRSLGVAVGRTAAPSSAGASGSFDCFAVSAEDEICVMGRKLVGSAQRRARGGVLQHGSIRLAPDPHEVTRAVGFAPGVATSLAALGMRVQREEVQDALTVAFRSALGTSLEESVLSAGERRSAERRVEIHRRELGERTRAP
jgi:lipoate-protein ligase A